MASATNYYTAAADALYQRLLFVRHLMPAGKANNLELGGLCEQSVRDLLRSVLPARFGVGYGHVAYGTDLGAGTKPLDVILYDALGYSPVYRDGEFVVVPPPAVLAVIEVKASLTMGEFRKALKQIEDAFGYDTDRTKPYPGFVLGFAGAPKKLWPGGTAGLADEQVMGYVEVAGDRGSIWRGAWRDHPTRGFAYWYWRLLEALYDGVGVLAAPLPDGYRTARVNFGQ
jgi:hypothetical protein